MSVSIIEALQNADYNLKNNNPIGIMMAKEQVHNATVLLDKGYDIWTEVEPLLEKYGNIDSVPEIDDINQDN